MSTDPLCWVGGKGIVDGLLLLPSVGIAMSLPGIAAGIERLYSKKRKYDHGDSAPSKKAEKQPY